MALPYSFGYNPITDFTGRPNAIEDPMGALMWTREKLGLPTNFGGMLGTSPLINGQPAGGGGGGGIDISPGGGFIPNAVPGSSSSSQSQSGINWQAPILSTIQPLLDESIQALPGLAQSYPQKIQRGYEGMMRTALSPQAMQGALNQLNRRGMINSSVAGDTLSKLSGSIASQIGASYYPAMMAGLDKQWELPSLLGNIAAGLGKESASVSLSESSDPLAPYKLMMDFLINA